ncbi:DUF4342 domain-containing protein [Candidatus Parcubacteria bacterium]|jgi:hypothetical protein|nr:MAG: DUF4342 domain-containing protein [Candidatus Parcubacteria bacterium]
MAPKTSIKELKFSIKDRDSVEEKSRFIDELPKLIRQDNIRRIKIKDERGETVFIVPIMLFGSTSFILDPILTAADTVFANLSECTVVLEKIVEADSGDVDTDKPGTFHNTEEE